MFLEEIEALPVRLLNLIKQWDQWGELRLELTQPYRGFFILLLKTKGPRVSIHHTQENTRQFPDSLGPQQSTVQSLPARLLYGAHRPHCSHFQRAFVHMARPPISSSLSGGKCKCAGVEMLQSHREVNGWRKQWYLWNSEAHWLKINSHKMTYWKLLRPLLLINASFFYGHSVWEGHKKKD